MLTRQIPESPKKIFLNSYESVMQNLDFVAKYRHRDYQKPRHGEHGKNDLLVEDNADDEVLIFTRHE